MEDHHSFVDSPHFGLYWAIRLPQKVHHLLLSRFSDLDFCHRVVVGKSAMATESQGRPRIATPPLPVLCLKATPLTHYSPPHKEWCHILVELGGDVWHGLGTLG